METWPLGVFVSCDVGLGLPLETVKEIGVPTVHLHAPQPQSRTAERAALLAAKFAELGIEATCLFAGFGGESYADIPTVQRTVGLAPAATRAVRLAELKQIADFGKLLGVSVVGLHVGFIPHDPDREEFGALAAAMQDMCQYCAAQGQAVHLETGQEPVEVLLKFIRRVGRDNLFVNFDPANMILYGTGEPLPALEQLGSHVRSVHCKDALWSDQPGKTWGTEVPLGKGQVNIEAYLRTLLKIGYTGPLTIEREIPQEHERQKAEILHAVTLLNHLKQQLSV